MEGVIHGNDLMVGTAILQIRIFSGSLNGTFHCFRTGIGEKDTIHAGYFFDLTSRLDGRHVVIIIGGVDHLVDLRFQRIVVCLVLIAQGKYSDSRYEIQIFFPIGVIQMYAFALIQNDLITVIGMQQVFFRLCNIFFHGVAHFSSPFRRRSFRQGNANQISNLVLR